VTRASRLAFGVVMILGAVVLVDHSIGNGHPRFGYEVHQGAQYWHAWQIIVGTWIAATLAGLAGLLIPDRGGRFRVASYVVPSVGIALMLPLTIHLLVAVAVGTDSVRAFDEWCLYSVIFAGAAHIAFAALAGARAKAIVEGREPMPVHALYAIVVAMSCVPGLLVVLPVIVTALTGIPILPLLYLMNRWAERARHEAELPVAVARIAS